MELEASSQYPQESATRLSLRRWMYTKFKHFILDQGFSTLLDLWPRFIDFQAAQL